MGGSWVGYVGMYVFRYVIAQVEMKQKERSHVTRGRQGLLLKPKSSISIFLLRPNSIFGSLFVCSLF